MGESHQERAGKNLTKYLIKLCLDDSNEIFSHVRLMTHFFEQTSIHFILIVYDKRDIIDRLVSL